MPLDFRNTNLLWASVMAETLQRLGLRTAVLCPGSRCAPLTIAFAQHPEIEAIPVLDERSASFFALGLARQHHRPVVLVCTSGTAGANFYPAVIEARESRVPLIILSADRPPELRHCHAGQAIDQVRLLGQYPVWQTELGLPEAQVSALAYLRQTLYQAWRWACSPGPVHLNCPLREPLAPIPQALLGNDLGNAPGLDGFDEEQFFQALPGWPQSSTEPGAPAMLPLWQKFRRGIIIAGPAQPADPAAYCEQVRRIAQRLHWPVLAEALNPLRNYQRLLGSQLICHYDPILRQPDWADALRPEAILRLGELPTSKVLRQWLSQQACPQWVISETPDNLDPLHSPIQQLQGSLAAIADQLLNQPSPLRSPTSSPDESSPLPNDQQQWERQWAELDRRTAHHLRAALAAPTTPLREPQIAWLLAQHLPPQTPLFVANSTPVRDLEWFWPRGDRQLSPRFNRGANGIDGTLSTALGLAHGSPPSAGSPVGSGRPSVLLTGDLALLHDTNGWLLVPRLRGHLTIVLINNNGGGIFELLPIAAFEPPFEDFFAMPQSLSFEALCQTYGADYERIDTAAQLALRLQALPSRGVRLLEIKTDRKGDRDWRSQLLQRASSETTAAPSWTAAAPTQPSPSSQDEADTR